MIQNASKVSNANCWVSLQGYVTPAALSYIHITNKHISKKLLC